MFRSVMGKAIGLTSSVAVQVANLESGVGFVLCAWCIIFCAGYNYAGGEVILQAICGEINRGVTS